MIKICKKCNVNKELEAFYFTKTTKDGRSSYCKLCSKLARREYYENNKEKQNTLSRTWEEKHPERTREARIQRDLRNKERRYETKRAWALANPNKIRASILKHRNKVCKI